MYAMIACTIGFIVGATADVIMHVCHRLIWAARYTTWLLIKLTPKGVVSFLFFSFLSQAGHYDSRRLAHAHLSVAMTVAAACLIYLK